MEGISGGMEPLMLLGRAVPMLFSVEAQEPSIAAESPSTTLATPFLITI
jgi:hypothetical protein